MGRCIGLLLVLLGVFAATQVWAQAKAPCSLLTPSEVTTIGATGQGIPSDMPVGNGPSKGETMKMCSWRMPTGGLHLAVARGAQGQSREAFMAQVTQSYAALKAQGWKQEEQNFGSVKCMLMTPPAGQQDAPLNYRLFW